MPAWLISFLISLAVKLIVSFILGKIKPEAQEVIGLLKAEKDPQAAEAFGVELKRAIEHFQKSGEKGPLLELRDRLRRRHGQSAGG